MLSTNKLSLNTTPGYTTGITIPIARLTTLEIFPSSCHPTSNGALRSLSLSFAVPITLLVLSARILRYVWIHSYPAENEKKNQHQTHSERFTYGTHTPHICQLCNMETSANIWLSIRSVCARRRQNGTMKFSQSYCSSVEIWSSRRTQRRVHVFRTANKTHTAELFHVFCENVQSHGIILDRVNWFRVK